MRQFFFISFILFLLNSCEKQDTSNLGQHFSELSPENSGVLFENGIIENDTINYFKFPYMYMGGGVSVGDINNDGLSDIYFTGNMVPNKLYLNKGNMQFEDITEAAGVAGDGRWYTGVTMADVNNDGWLDIYACVSGKYTTTKNQLFINNKDNTFTERSNDYGLDDESHSIHATFFDYDRDGFLDVLIGNYPIVLVSQGNKYYHTKMSENLLSESAHLFKNNGDNTFSDVTEKSGVKNFGLSLGVVASDLNNDGWQDIYISNDFNVPDYFYLNNGNGTFKEVLKEAINHTSLFGMGTDAADFNNDGLIDIMQLDMTYEDHKKSKINMGSMSTKSFYEALELGLHYQYMQNTVQLNNGVNEDGIPIFSDIARISGLAATDWSWGTLFADFDNDGLKDVIVTNGMIRDVNNNDANNQYYSQSLFGDAKKMDYKIYPSNPVDNYVFKNNGDLTFTKVNDKWGLKHEGFSNGISYGDFDNDGDLDIVMNNLGSVSTIFKNETKKDQNYIKVKITGSDTNPNGIGTRVTIKTADQKQLQELILSRGYQSSVEPILHFGLGGHKLVEEVNVKWPNGTTQTLKNISSNQLLEIKFDSINTKSLVSVKDHNSNKFKDITNLSGIKFIHKENNYNDFDFEPLLPHKNSQFGPGIAVGDVNNDGLDDFFAGNAAGSSGAMYIQNINGSFEIMSGPWEEDSNFEDMEVLLFDADNDKDLDLYVVSGGNQKSKPQEFYQDRIYINTKEGFRASSPTLPKINSSGQTVKSGDFDNDGDLDLFIGGRLIPGQYPLPAQSYILRNDGGQNLSLKYTDITDALIPELKTAGLVTSALWDDFNNDNHLDLIITGEWMPIRFFKNNGNSFKEVTNKLGFKESTGWWYSLQKTDVDGDGDLDYLAGNLGLNYKYKASKEVPFEVYANDFDENKTLDIVLGYEKQGKKLPLRGRECSSQQIPAIKNRFKTYESFANASLSDIYGKSMLKESLHYFANTFAHYWIENQGNSSFIKHQLPNRAQLSSINTFEAFDYNGDKYPDIFLGGNLYGSEVETPRNDASIGLLLTGSSNGNFDVVPPEESNLFLKGDVKKIISIRLGKNKKLGFLCAVNNDSLKLLVLN